MKTIRLLTTALLIIGAGCRLHAQPALSQAEGPGRFPGLERPGGPRL